MADAARPAASGDSSVAVFVVPTDENLMIARHTREVLDQSRRHN